MAETRLFTSRVRPLPLRLPSQPPQIHTVEGLAAEYRTQRHLALDRRVQYWWLRVLLFVGSYYLFLSDVIRGGLGIRALQEPYLQVQPDAFVSFGPYAYPVVTVDLNATSDQHVSDWVYKFDTTSIGMRAIVELYNVSGWPPCMRYHAGCTNNMVSFPTVFSMLDRLVDTVAEQRPTPWRDATIYPITITTRIKYHWRDRLHHLVLPEVFERLQQRTTRAMYYSTNALRYQTATGLCTSRRHRPYACDDFWVNFARVRMLRVPGGPEHVGNVFRDVEARARLFLAKNDGQQHQVDMLLLDSSDDPSLGGVSMRGERMADVVVITRVRTCQKSTTGGGSVNCTTVHVNDYRYESVVVTSEVISWFPTISGLRIAGQVFIWCRLLLLLIGCYHARKADAEFATASWPRRLYGIYRLLLQIPSQVVIYGSFLPVLCYAVAQAIDAPMTHVLVAEIYRTMQGHLSVDPGTFVSTSTVQMRNVWMFAAMAYAFVLLQTRQLHLMRYAGILCACKFSLSVISATTTMAHYRSLSFRNTSVLDVVAVAENRNNVNVKTQQCKSTSAMMDTMLLGSTVDFKMLLAGIALVSSVTLVLATVLRYIARFQTRMVLWARNDVSYATPHLWPLTSMVIAWHGNFLVQDIQRQNPVHADVSRFEKAAHSHVSGAGIGTATAREKFARKATIARQTDLGFDSVPHRDDGTTLVFLKNLCMMTDPMTFLHLRYGQGTNVAFFRSHETGDLHLLPHDLYLGGCNSDIQWHSLELVLVANSTELLWIDLLCCG
ncbi:TPA: hypothetical protein N0F65_011175 [Lagenidium giganteum]|uniref:Uncharacterized protein n=1 Tax=Lagenidium giganteum TaxID=4803 RepID=A0AAV2Z583_9STRA|nr:TPA: hypothetical protein N0F65_011175 [Lagenidium giganteum]